MQIIPAIDIKGGKVVRLSQGKFHEITIYANDPLKTAKEWVACGAKTLHVIDLDGAEKGQIVNMEVIARIAKHVDVPIQMGGGIRTKLDIEKLFACGIKRVILGTKVINDKEFLKEIIDLWGENIMVSLDTSRGIVAKDGWTTLSDLKVADFALELQNLGLSNLIFTDISRDGTLRGPNIEAIRELLKTVSIFVFASGGVSSLKDVSNLLALEKEGLRGIIVGKAIYERQIFLKDAIELCSKKG